MFAKNTRTGGICKKESTRIVARCSGHISMLKYGDRIDCRYLAHVWSHQADGFNNGVVPRTYKDRWSSVRMDFWRNVNCTELVCSCGVRTWSELRQQALACDFSWLAKKLQRMLSRMRMYTHICTHTLLLCENRQSTQNNEVAQLELPSPHTCKAAARRLPFCCLLFARCLSLIVAFFFDVTHWAKSTGSHCHSAECCCKAKTRLGRCYAISGCP